MIPSVNKNEASNTLDDGGEHKFLLGEQTPVYIQRASRESQVNPKLHEHLAAAMIALGKFTPEELIKGGYCRVISKKLKYWGESSYPIMPASENDFFRGIESRGIELLDDI
jgi:hypothetical protein